jgi:hypothetical protein
MDPQEIRQLIGARSQRLATLFEEIAQIHDRRIRIVEESEPRKGPEQYEGMRQRLEQTQLVLDTIGEEIKRLQNEMGTLRESLQGRQTGAAETCTGSARAASDARGLEELRLQQQLHDLVDALIVTIRQWNENAVEGERAAFEEQFCDLRQKYRAALAELDASRVGKGRPPHEDS